MLAQGVHYAMVAAGLLGLAALLSPQVLHRVAVAPMDPSTWRLRSVAFRHTDRTAALIALVGNADLLALWGSSWRVSFSCARGADYYY